MTLEPLRRFLSILRPVVMATTVLGMVAALAAWHAGMDEFYKAALTSATVLVMFCLCGQMIASVIQGRIGLDVIAFLSMGSALIFEEHLAAAIVALMYAGGQYLESYAEGRARREMTTLLARAPRTTIRRRNDRLETIIVEAIAVGDLLTIRRGDTVPVDGKLEGSASLDDATLTGEPFPVSRFRGDLIRSGAVNAGDIFSMTATKTASESTYAGIVRLVEAAHRSQAPMSRLADRYALVFLLLTLGLAASAWLLGGEPTRAVAVLVIATPCPLILAVPVAWTAGTSRAAGAGLLVKGSDVLERLGQLRTLVIDKTGTLTSGRPRLVGLDAVSDETDLLQLVASLDQGSNHVAAKALVDAAHEKGLALFPPVDVSEKPGEGISGQVQGRRVAIGGSDYIAHVLSISVPTVTRRDVMSAAVAIDGKYAGSLLFSDLPRAGVKETLSDLRGRGLTRIILATGDRAEVATATSEGLLLDEVRAGLCPQDKIQLVQREASLAPVMMIGDGINDAPALAAADVGVAMGVHGAAAAVETADAVLLVENLDRICVGIDIAKHCRRIAMQCVFVGIGLSVSGMIIAAAGLLKPIEGAILQEAIDVAVVLNALRALRSMRNLRDALLKRPSSAASSEKPSRNVFNDRF